MHPCICIIRFRCFFLFGNCHIAPLVKAVVKWKMDATIIVIEAHRAVHPHVNLSGLKPEIRIVGVCMSTFSLAL